MPSCRFITDLLPLLLHLSLMSHEVSLKAVNEVLLLHPHSLGLLELLLQLLLLQRNAVDIRLHLLPFLGARELLELFQLSFELQVGTSLPR